MPIVPLFNDYPAGGRAGRSLHHIPPFQDIPGKDGSHGEKYGDHGAGNLLPGAREAVQILKTGYCSPIYRVVLLKPIQVYTENAVLMA